MAIDVGAGAIDRATTLTGSAYTVIGLDNSANATGTIDTVEVWVETGYTITGFRAGLFFLVSGTTYQCRSSTASLGDVVGGSKQTFTGLSLSVTTGDYIGYYGNIARVSQDTTGFAGILYVAGEYIDVNDSTSYATLADDAISLYGTGTEAGGAGGAPVCVVMMMAKKRG